MSDINNFSNSQELMDYQLKSIKFYLRKWMMVILISLLLIQGFSFIYFNYTVSQLNEKLVILEKKIDYRYFLIIESLEDIHKVKIEDGRIIWQQSNNSNSR